MTFQKPTTVDKEPKKKTTQETLQKASLTKIYQYTYHIRII